MKDFLKLSFLLGYGENILKSLSLGVLVNLPLIWVIFWGYYINDLKFSFVQTAIRWKLPPNVDITHG